MDWTGCVIVSGSEALVCVFCCQTFGTFGAFSCTASALLCCSCATVAERFGWSMGGWGLGSIEYEGHFHLKHVVLMWLSCSSMLTHLS